MTTINKTDDVLNSSQLIHRIRIIPEHIHKNYYDYPQIQNVQTSSR